MNGMDGVRQPLGSNGNNKVISIGPLMNKAIEDLREKADTLVKGEFGISVPINDTNVAEVLAFKYLHKNFGKASADDVARILGVGGKNGWTRRR